MTFAPRTKSALAMLLLLALGLVLLATGPGAPRADARGGCANVNAEPSEATASEFEKAVTCLLNQRRTSRGIEAAGGNRKLKDVAGAHAKKMVAQDCFRHVCAGERSLRRRLEAVGYIGDGAFRFGEVNGYASTPKEMVHRLMSSDAHRKLILAKRFDDVGVGAAKGAPVEGKPDGKFVTYTVIFGFNG